MKIWLFPLLFLGLVAPFTPFLDLYFSSLFYMDGREFTNPLPFHILFKYGEIFGLLTGALALLVYLLSFGIKKIRPFQKGALVMVLTLVIGAGLLTNVLFKGYWGRPRPKQIVEFGGEHDYRPFWKPHFHAAPEPQRSFPSGHVAMGFYFLSLVLVGRRYNNQKLVITGILLTASLGGGLMIARVGQGGHFFSDVIVSPVLMWLVALGTDRVVFTWGGSSQKSLDSRPLDTSPELETSSEAYR